MHIYRHYLPIGWNVRLHHMCILCHVEFFGTTDPSCTPAELRYVFSVFDNFIVYPILNHYIPNYCTKLWSGIGLERTSPILYLLLLRYVNVLRLAKILLSLWIVVVYWVKTLWLWFKINVEQNLLGRWVQVKIVGLHTRWPVHSSG